MKTQTTTSKTNREDTMTTTKINDKNGGTYSLDLDNLTVLEYADGKTYDLNPTDEPCEGLLGLWYLIRQLWEMRGEYSADTMEALHQQMPNLAN